MNIDFRETFKSLSTAELLNIVMKPDDYQAEAVLAANEILKDRTITEADTTESERIITNVKDHWIDEKEILNYASIKIKNLVEPIIKPETTVNTKKWMSILMVTLGTFCMWRIIELILRWRRLSELNRIDRFKLFEIIPIFYLLVTIGGLYKKKKWGWMLLMIFAVEGTLEFVMGFFLSIIHSFLHREMAGTVFWALIYGSAVYLLSQKDTRDYFNIKNEFFRNTIFAAVIVFLLILVYFKYFYA